MEAATKPDAIRGLVLIYPAFVLFDDARELFASPDDIPEIYNHRGNDVGRVYFERSLDYDIFATMATYRRPVLIIHGTQDTVAPISYSERAVQTFEAAQLKSIPGAGHFFSEAQINEFLPDIEGFITSTLQG